MDHPIPDAEQSEVPPSAAISSDPARQWDRQGLTMLMFAYAGILVLALISAWLHPITGWMSYAWLALILLNMLLCGCARSTTFRCSPTWLMVAWCCLFPPVLAGFALGVWDLGGSFGSGVSIPMLIAMLAFPAMLPPTNIRQVVLGPRPIPKFDLPPR